MSFLTHKAGGDSNSGDSELAAWWAGVKNLDPTYTLLGTYWVPRPDLYPQASKEADRWIATLDARCPGWRDRPHILQIDAERWPGGDKTMPGKAYLQALADRLCVLAPRLRPIVYASRGQYGDTLTGLGYPLWNARYPTSAAGKIRDLYARVGGDDGPGWVGYSGQTPAVWQFSSTATIGGQTTCDANAYRGTLAQLVALVAPGWTEDQMELADKYGDTAWPGRTVQNRLKDDAMLRDVWWGDPQGTKAANLPASSPLAKVIALPAQVAALTAAVTALSGKDFTDEGAIIAGVLAGLSPEKIAAAIPQDIAAEVADILAQRLQS